MYLWLALERLAGRRSWVHPSLALGVCIWLHSSALLLIPSLALLPWIAPRDRGRGNTPQLLEAVRSVALATTPLLAFLALMALTGRHGEFENAWNLGLHIVGTQRDPLLIRRWIRGFGGTSIGTDVTFLSWPHLKYLINAAYVLLPIAVPGALLIALRVPGAFFRSPTARFLLATCVPFLGYALVLRPVWGPFDWDLFAAGALCLGCLVAHVLASRLDEASFRDLAIVAIGFQLLYVGAPFLLMSAMDLADAGPFAPGYFDYNLFIELHPASPKLAPWL